MDEKEKAYEKFLNELKNISTTKNLQSIRNIDDLYEAFENYNSLRDKERKSLNKKNMNFGLMNYIMESNIYKLFKSDRRHLIKEYIDIIRNDKNLSSEYQLIESLSNYKLDNEAPKYLNEAISLISGKIDKGGLFESHLKIMNFLKKNHIIKENIDSEKKNFFKNCDFIIKNKKKMSNLNEITKSMNEISEYMEKNKKVIKESKNISLDKILNEYNNKYSQTLNEDEKELVKEMFTSDATKNANKEKLFNSLKKECIEEVNRMIENKNDEEKEGLLSLKEGLLNMEYQESTLVEDITKLLEMKDVLIEE